MSSWLNELSAKVSSAAGKVSSAVMHDDSLLEKLTLTTPELRAERQALDAAERRKERVRDALAGMLPWETRDPERDILVEECRDAVLQLSKEKSTFFGPYPMPKLDAKVEDDEKEDESEKKGKEEEGPGETEPDDPFDPIKPSAESREKLQKLEPLPPLLQDFDFNAHVGLIEKILKEDADLVEMQAKLSGGGARERVFWRNYFFHCAFTRYEAGLSIDEIWGDLTEEERAAAARQHERSAAQQAAGEPEAAAAAHETSADAEEETITFHDEASDPKGSKQQEPAAAEAEGDSSNETYEMVEGVAGADDGGGGEDAAIDEVAAALDDEIAADAGDDDYELDELEAEIARELED